MTFLILYHALFWGVFILISQANDYKLRGYWGLLPVPLLALGGWLFTIEAFKHLKISPLPRWHKFLLQMLLGPSLIFMIFVCSAFLVLTLGGMISPSDYANYTSPSEQRSVTIVSHNITCTQTVYLNRGLIMQQVGSFKIGTAKCLSYARAEIQWLSRETSISWKYEDRQGVIQLPTDN